jgi:hypothetical protein
VETRQIDISNAERQINNGLIKGLMKEEGHNWGGQFNLSLYKEYSLEKKKVKSTWALGRSRIFSVEDNSLSIFDLRAEALVKQKHTYLEAFFHGLVLATEIRRFGSYLCYQKHI